jgi:2-polyprenyl-3-methyl-5-hydroxy-6-metoxy-1,4-benzoquinol methylase
MIQDFLDTSFAHEGREVQLSMSNNQCQALFDRIRAQWQEYGNSEPFASVLSDNKFLRQNIEQSIHVLDSSGIEMVRRLLVLAERNSIVIPRGRCLELGCGVGRITQPLCQLFDKVIAADISLPHLKICEDRVVGAAGRRVELMHLTAPEQISTVQNIDVFVSVIVLQHNPPPIQYFLLDKVFENIQKNGIVFFQTATFNPSYGYNIDRHLAMGTEDFNSWSLHCLPMKSVFQLFKKHRLEAVEVVEDGQSAGHQNRFHSHTFLAIKQSLP